MQSGMKGKSISCWIDNLYLFFLGLYVLLLVLRTTFFNLDIPGSAEQGLLICLTLFALCRVCLLLLSEPAFRSRFLRVLVFSIPVAAVWMLVYRNDGYPFLLFLAVLTIGCVGMDYRKVLKLYVAVVGLTVATAIICALGEAITNLVYNDSSRLRLRSSWGIAYPTDLTAYFVYLCIAAWIGWRKLPNWVFVFPGVIALFLSFYIARCYTGALSCFLFLSVLALHALLEHRSLPRLQKLVDRLSAIAFPVFGAVMVGFTWLYHRGNHLADRINTLNHFRFSYPSRAYDEYGLHLFGAPLTQIGGGGSTFSFQNPDYNFVDCTYLLVLLRYGAVTLIMLAMLWFLMTRHAAKIRDRRLMLGLALIAFHSVSEHHFTELNYNILLILPFAVLCVPPLEEPVSVPAQVSAPPKRLSAALITGLGLSLVAVVFLPKLFSCFRTLCNVLEMDSGVYHQRALFLAVFFGLAFLLYVIRSLYQAVRVALCGQRPNRRVSLALILCAVCVLTGILGMNLIFRRSAEQRQSELEADNTAMEALLSAGDPFYVSKIPELYAKSYAGVKPTVYATEDLGRLHDISVLVDAECDSEVFTSRGFLYTEISDRHAVYTNSQKAIQALSDAGFHLTGYYSRCKNVDLAALAAYDSLPSPGDGSLLLTADRPLRFGPYYELYNSSYTVSFDLSLQASDGGSLPDLEDNTPICTLRVSSRWGQNIIREEVVKRNQFDREEILTVDVTCAIPKAQGVEFLVFPHADNVTVVLHGIRYQKTPTYDTQKTFNQKWQKVREAYYDLDGNPYTVTAGYDAREFAYDSRNNTILERFYDAAGNPVVNTSGYAEVRRAFNFKKQIIREEYYAPNGDPAVLSNGYSAVDREYDAEGNLTVQHFFDANNQPVLRTEGYSTLVREFNKKKQIVREEYYGTDGTPVALPAGYYALEYGYDDVGNRNLVRYLDEEGHSFTLSGGFAELHRVFNVNKQITREAYFDADGNPVMRKEGYAAIEYERDHAGNVLVYRYYDFENRSVIRDSGYAELHREYNEKKQIIYEAYFDTEGAPIAMSAGYFAVQYGYDEAGNRNWIRYLDDKDRPLTVSDGYVELHRVFDEKKQVVRDEYCDAGGTLILRKGNYASEEYDRDDAGNVIMNRYYGLDGALTLRSGGYAERHRAFNAQKKVVREEYYGTEGQPILIDKGYSVIERSYDENGTLLSEVFLDLDGNAVVPK